MTRRVVQRFVHAFQDACPVILFFLTSFLIVYRLFGLSYSCLLYTSTMEDRLEKGVQAQVDIFGDHMKEAWKAGHINRWLAANCFGDYYTRTGLDLAKREMITFCFLMAQGGCEPQLTAHAKGNMNLGNDKAFLVKVVSQCLPYIGYPRSLNAIACINKAAEQ